MFSIYIYIYTHMYIYICIYIYIYVLLILQSAADARISISTNMAHRCIRAVHISTLHDLFKLMWAAVCRPRFRKSGTGQGVK